MSASGSGPLIASISVRQLFGTRSYEIAVPKVDGKPSRLLLIHGDNGAGKTTLLRLVWHALSSADNVGHRTFIAKTPFAELSVIMTGGREIRVKKKEGLLGSFSVSVIQAGEKAICAEYEASDDLMVRSPSRAELRPYLEAALRDRGRLPGATGRREIERIRETLSLIDGSRGAERRYLDFLVEEVRTPLYLADDRSLYSDDPDINRMREMFSRREDGDRRDRLARLAFIELQVTIQRVNDHLRSLTLGGQNDGSANSNAIYMDVLRQLVEAQTGATSQDEHSSSVYELLDEIALASPDYEKFGLVPKLDTVEFRDLLSRTRGTDLANLAERVVSPFLSSLRARYAALEEAHALLKSLIPTVNEFLSGKELRFSPRRGLSIATVGGEALEVEMLSSGERQLLMLLCTTLLARVDTNIFIIDEPELSLGVEWQRKILDALVGLTEGTNLQFLVATHSIEIISARPASLVQLRAM